MPAPSKITYQEFQKLLLSTDVPDEVIAEFVVVDPRKTGPFNPVLKPDPRRVEMSFEEIEAESAMSMGNGLARFRRQLRFRQRLLTGSPLPVLVAEGDSWFQFPILIEDVVDQLGDEYLVWCVSAAGDTAQNIVYGDEGTGRREYLKALREQKTRVRAFLFSAAGNDIIGEDADGVAVISKILKDHIPGADAAAHIDLALFGQTLAFLKKAYTEVIQQVRKEPGLEKLPIIVHGYDYAIPGSPTDPRDPAYAKPDQWLGGPMAKKGITTPALQRDIVRLLIDALYDMLRRLAEDHPHVHVVDARRTLPEVSDWNDEIHGTSAGFRRVAKKFKTVLSKVVG